MTGAAAAADGPPASRGPGGAETGRALTFMHGTAARGAKGGVGSLVLAGADGLPDYRSCTL
jgi:hypothetical protein